MRFELSANIPKRLIKLREKTGLTQQKIAEKIGVNTSTITRWQNGDTAPVGLSLASLERLLKRHGVA